MTTAATPAPTNDVNFMLGKLMERTEGLPAMQQTVARTEQRVANLEKQFKVHDEEMRRMRSASTSDKVKAAKQEGYARGRVKGIMMAGGAAGGAIAAVIDLMKWAFPHGAAH